MVDFRKLLEQDEEAALKNYVAQLPVYGVDPETGFTNYTNPVIPQLKLPVQGIHSQPYIPTQADLRGPVQFMPSVQQGIANVKDIYQHGFDTPENLSAKVFGPMEGGSSDVPERTQAWPEKIVRSGTTLANDVMAGKVLSGPGLRAGDYSDIPGAPEPLANLIERTQDMAGLAAGGSIAATGLKAEKPGLLAKGASNLKDRLHQFLAEENKPSFEDIKPTNAGETAIQSFIEGNRKNAWIDVPEGKIYLRQSSHPRLGSVVDIANIDFETKGTGAFTKYLNHIEDQVVNNDKFNGIRVENIFNKRLETFLEKKGFTKEGANNPPTLIMPKSRLELLDRSTRFAEDDIAGTAVGAARNSEVGTGIRNAAYKIGDKIFEAPNHATAVGDAKSFLGAKREIDLIDMHPGENLKDKLNSHNEASGFVTNTGHFISRKEAQGLFNKKSEIENKRLGGLNSEDLKLNNLADRLHEHLNERPNISNEYKGESMPEILARQRASEGYEAAIRDPETKKLYTGMWHEEVLDKIAKDRGVPKAYLPDNLIKGYINDRGRFLTEEAVEKLSQNKARSKTAMFRSDDEAGTAIAALNNQTWYHGTTHDFEKFKINKGNPENYFGQYPHFTSNPKDASINYAGHGPDLTARIERRTEEIFDKIRDKRYGGGEVGDDYGKVITEAKRKAVQELAGPHEGAIIPSTFNLRNPVNVSTKNSTWLDFNPKYNKNGDIVKESPLTLKLLNSLEKQGQKYGFNGRKAFDEISEKAGLYDGDIKASDLNKAIREADELLDAQDNKGRMTGQHVAANVFKDLGHDGIIMDAKEAFPHMRTIPEGTMHAIPLKSNTVKSKITGQTLFSDDIVGTGLAAAAPRFYSHVENIAKAAPEKMTANEWKAYLKNKGATKEELEALRVHDLLGDDVERSGSNAAQGTPAQDALNEWRKTNKGKPPDDLLKASRAEVEARVKAGTVKDESPVINREDLINHLNENKVELNERWSGEHPKSKEILELANRDRAIRQRLDIIDEQLRLRDSDTPSAQKARKDLTNEKQTLEKELEEIVKKDKEFGNTNFKPRFAQYQLPGGSNYRELLLSTKDNPKNLKRVEEINNEIRNVDQQINYINKNINHDQINTKNLEALNEIKKLNAESKGNSILAQSARARRNELQEEIFKELKDRKYNLAAERLDLEQSFTHDHWPGQKDVVVHSRMNDRFIPDESGSGLSGDNKNYGILPDINGKYEVYQKDNGKGLEGLRKKFNTEAEAQDFINQQNKKGYNTLHAEEVQSDWLQQGNSEGFKLSAKDKAKLEPEFNRIEEKIVNSGDEQVMSNPEIKDAVKLAVDKKIITEAEAKTYLRYSDSERLGAVKDAPFKSTWSDLMIKRLIRQASEEGKDAISWTPGQTQVDRYPQLQQHYDRLEYNPTTHEFKAYNKEGRLAKSETLDKSDLVRHIGKEVTDKLINNPSKKIKDHDNAEAFGNNHILENVDLKVGGEFHKKFYDEIMVNKVNAIAKKYGARVEEKEIPQNHDASLNEPFTNVSKAEDIIKRGGEVYGVVNGNEELITSIKDLKEIPYSHFFMGDKQPKQPIWFLKLTPELKKAALDKGFSMFETGLPLTPVDHDPFERKKHRLVPVSHNPFSQRLM